jgi:hypothetical protein
MFFLGKRSPTQDTLNGSILNVAAIIKNVVASAAESEVRACFHNAQSGAPLRVILTELGHTQPLTPLQTDNTTAFGILIPQVRLAHKYPISPWEMIHPPGGDNPVRI